MDALPGLQAIEDNATFSVDAGYRYRYDLTRGWPSASRELALWIMLNPSTADAVADDPTIRRFGFSKGWGYGGLVVCNAFALRSTDPRVLYDADDPVGPLNDSHLRGWAADPRVGVIVCAWGAHGDLNGRSAQMRELLEPVASEGRPLLCLGHTQKGEPKHPLYLSGESELVAW